MAGKDNLTLEKLYNFSIDWGIRCDPRGRKIINSLLQKEKKRYEKLTEKEKEFFDEERFSNPYSDSRILFGDRGKSIKSALVGVDMEIGEVMLADRLRSGGKKIDLILAHHPEGRAMAERQLEDFRQVAEAVRAAGVDPGILHAANSAAVVNLPGSHFDMVRPGILAYGLVPSEAVPEPGGLKPVMRFVSRLVHVRELPAGHAVSG